ncbi:MAG: hypothetical protein GY809_04460 [Planctomycetes bacterium]|nr:hypothetical protein [Planctomycetota bacterium]
MQRVLAFNAWLSDVPTWQLKTVDNHIMTDHAPPYYEGSTLGGFDRMRAFPDNRFHDRSAAYYSAGYRAIPDWNSLENLSWLPVNVNWWQWVIYGEVGRVAGNLNLRELHEDMKWDVGAGIRVFSEGSVGRLSVAVSRKDVALLVMFGHPF